MLNIADNKLSYRRNFDEFYRVDVDGFLVNASDWDENFSQQEAAILKIELDQRHWKLIECIRDKYIRLSSIPPMRRICRAADIHPVELKQQFGSHLNFWKLSGLPNPGEEARSYMN